MVCVFSIILISKGILTFKAKDSVLFVNNETEIEYEKSHAHF